MRHSTLSRIQLLSNSPCHFKKQCKERCRSVNDRQSRPNEIFRVGGKFLVLSEMQWEESFCIESIWNSNEGKSVLANSSS